ncbi:MAG: hypothetical protein R2912_05615 [Eubacteriales bacterium]
MDGTVTVLKTPGMTSSNVVFDVRKIFGEKRAGHLGTLDPAAAGVLPVCLGRATRLFDILVDKDKEYVFECFGTQTDTQDAYEVIIAQDYQAHHEGCAGAGAAGVCRRTDADGFDLFCAQGRRQKDV